MNFAFAELTGTPHPAGGRRFHGQGPTTWVTYQTFRHRPRVPSELDHFLEPCANRAQVLAAYADAPDHWSMAVRIRLPAGSWWAYLLTHSQGDWFTAARRDLLSRLSVLNPSEQFTGVLEWRGALPGSPIPMSLLHRLEALLPEEENAQNVLPLSSEAHAIRRVCSDTNDRRESSA